MHLMYFLLGGRVKQMLLSSDQINRSRWIKTVKRLTGFCFDPAAGNNNCNSNAICGSGSVSCSASTAATVVKPNNNNCSSSAVNNHKEFYCWQQAHQVRHGVQNNFILCFAETVPCVCLQWWSLSDGSKIFILLPLILSWCHLLTHPKPATWAAMKQCNSCNSNRCNSNSCNCNSCPHSWPPHHIRFQPALYPSRQSLSQHHNPQLVKVLWNDV